jgi:endonuclease/exonuclease/phosphatase family metal-dependent hydrolase
VRLRVLVYNVHGFRGGVGRVVQLTMRLDPDVLLLNETGGRLRLRRFARRMGLVAATDPWSPLRRRVKDAVLVRPPWRIVEHRLVRFAPADRWSPRGAIVAGIGRNDLRMVVVATHLGLRPAERIAHARELVGLVADRHGPAIVGGDLNERPDGRAVAIVTRQLSDAWALGGGDGGETFPAADPTARIDYLFVSAELRVERAMVPSVLPEARAASDHLPLVVELASPRGG